MDHNPALPDTSAPASPASGYLSGEHQPVADELSVADLRVVGALPRELRGMFVRNTPNPRFAPLGKYHWFDGDGMVHGVRFDDGKAAYQNRYVRTAGFVAEEDAGRALWTGILEPPRKDGPRIPLKDTANTDLIVHRGRLYATWWLAGTPYELDVTDLSTKGPERFDGKLTGNMSAHPKVDPRTGELVFFDYNLMKPPYLRYGVVDAAGRLVCYEPIDIPAPHILHDCAITERFSILLDLPLGWDKDALAHGKRKIKFERETPGRFGVIPRRGDNNSIVWFDVEPCYVYHMINAYEDGDDIVMVGCRVRDLIPAERSTDDTVARLDTIELKPLLHEWRLNLRTKAVRERDLDDVPTEFPRAHDGRLGTAAVRTAWAPRIAKRRDTMFDGVIKYDVRSGAAVHVDYAALVGEPGWYGSEVVFVPRPGASAADGDDDGWAVTILTKAGQPSKCIVLDGKEPTRGPVALVELPQQVPIGFHAAFVPHA